ncbi:MAG: ACT domain-containing protein [Desulfobacterales bacterium]|nr:ACT domain-containing protein [Desulfobacterales bacterium]
MAARHLDLLPEPMGICRLDSGRPIPAWATKAGFYSITGTSEELSVVCPEASIPDGVVCSRGWRLFRVKGPLDFSETGVLASLAGPLGRAGISIFVVSTYDTDMLLVRSEQLEAAVDVLRTAGHRVSI